MTFFQAPAQFKMPKKKSFSLTFKKEVIQFMDNQSAYAAAKYFGGRDNCFYDPSMFRQWYKKRAELENCGSNRCRATGGGRKPKLGSLEEIIYDEVIELRLAKVKVTRAFIAERALQLAQETGTDLKASDKFVDGFLKRYNFSLRRAANLTTLTDEQVIVRAVSFMKYLHQDFSLLNLSKTLLMDETATGYASMHITAVMAVWADGTKATPLIIHKGSGTKTVEIISESGINYTFHEKSWVDSEVIIKWIDVMFPIVDVTPGKCIVWDACKAHLSAAVKNHLKARDIKLIVIPRGMTAYFQAGDIGIFRCFKDFISELTDGWKNLNPPPNEVVREWIKEAWRQVNTEIVKSCVEAAGFSQNFRNWHISKHDVYGERFMKAWQSCVQSEDQVIIVLDSDDEDDPNFIFE